jgi:hypothetical protein
VYGSFKDLKSLDWTDTLDVVVGNVIWPFKQFGAFGCLISLIYWPIVIPLTLLVALVYVVPTLYLTMRMIVYSAAAIRVRISRRKKSRPYQINASVDRSVLKFRVENWCESFVGQSLQQRQTHDECDNANQWAERDDDFDIDVDVVTMKDHVKTPRASITSSVSVILYTTYNWLRVVGYTALAVVCILNLFSTMLILSEVAGCVVEVAVFTVMGIVVNASELLKYVMLIMMVFVHVCDCFNGIEKKYLKLNKALFGEVKSRIRDLSEITSLPSFLQVLLIDYHPGAEMNPK